MKLTAKIAAVLVFLALALVAIASLAPQQKESSLIKKDTSDVVLESPDLLPTPEPIDTTVIKKQIKRLTVHKSAVVGIFDEITSDTLPVATRISMLSNNNEPTILLINSPGGSVLDGAQIISAMQASRTPVYTVCMQLCASMAAIIESYGAKRLVVDRSILMYHNASINGMGGRVPDIYSRLNMLDRYVKKMDAYIAKRVGISLDEYLNMQSNELWLDAEDAVNKNFADAIVTLDLSELNSEAVNTSEVTSSKAIAAKLKFKMEN